MASKTSSNSGVASPAAEGRLLSATAVARLPVSAEVLAAEAERKVEHILSLLRSASEHSMPHMGKARVACGELVSRHSVWNTRWIALRHSRSRFADFVRQTRVPSGHASGPVA
jgi:hypothetical protein